MIYYNDNEKCGYCGEIHNNAPAHVSRVITYTPHENDAWKIPASEVAKSRKAAADYIAGMIYMRRGVHSFAFRTVEGALDSLSFYQQPCGMYKWNRNGFLSHGHGLDLTQTIAECLNAE